MGAIFFLTIFWPIVLAVGVFALILPYIPYITLAHGIFWLLVGILAKFISTKYQLFKKGLSHKKTWVRIITDIFRWVIYIDIVANIILIIGAIILAVVFIAKGITPIPS
ncbi:hypothetical protein IJV57_00365 [Candidatus Saccharibacteria bacterium]|nr:hypothetical protein [Candidatus Saccharibacteria bacterium]